MPWAVCCRARGTAWSTTRPAACCSVNKATGEFNGTGTVSTSRGSRWCNGVIAYMTVNTILPPNSPACTVGADFREAGQYPVQSRHTGGAHVLLGDGAVRFVSENIDSGNLSVQDVRNATGPSPYGVWGAWDRSPEMKRSVSSRTGDVSH